MSSSNQSYTFLKDTSISLSDLSIEDRDLFAAALYRPLEIWVEYRTPDGLSLLNDAKQRERERIRELPSYLLQKQAIFHGVLLNKPHPKGFCKTHDTLHPYIIGSILHKIRHEVTGPQFNILIPLKNPVAKSLADSLKRINAYWTTPHDHTKVFPTISDTSSGPVVFQENGCDACILAAIAGNTEVLETLRTSSFSKRRAGGRLVGWLDCWLAMRGPGVWHEVQKRSEKNAHTLRKLKCGRIRTNDKRRRANNEAIAIDDEEQEGLADNPYWSSGISEDENRVVKRQNTNLGIMDDYIPGWV